MLKCLCRTLLLLCFITTLECCFAQVAPIRTGSGSKGIESQLLLSGNRVLCFTKKANMRNIYAVGSSIKIQLTNKEKVSGNINLINDTAIVIRGRYYNYDKIAAYYVPMRTARFLGTAFFIAGGGCILVDGINGIIKNHSPIFNVESFAVGIPLIAAGGVLFAFKDVKRKTSVWKLLVMDL